MTPQAAEPRIREEGRIPYVRSVARAASAARRRQALQSHTWCSVYCFIEAHGSMARANSRMLWIRITEDMTLRGTFGEQDTEDQGGSLPRDAQSSAAAFFLTGDPDFIARAHHTTAPIPSTTAAIVFVKLPFMSASSHQGTYLRGTTSVSATLTRYASTYPPHQNATSLSSARRPAHFMGCGPAASRLLFLISLWHARVNDRCKAIVNPPLVESLAIY